MRAQLVAARQVEPGEHHDLIARSQVLGTLRDLLLELLDQCDAVCNLAASGPTQQQPAPRSADGPGLPRTAVRTLQRRAPLRSRRSKASVTRHNSRGQFGQ